MTASKEEVEGILFAASAGDPAIRLQNLERDVDLVRISIKRILMDIRERMNELENPLVIVSPLPAASARKAAGPAPAAHETSHKVPEPPDTRPECSRAGAEARDSATPAVPARDTVPDPCRSSQEALKPSAPARDIPVPHLPARPKEIVVPLALPAAFSLFCWTQNGVKRYGHTRFGVLIETYRVMGYIGLKSSREVHQISCLMPPCSGDECEIGPGDFVSEIYHLRRILAPDDTSLDRDMVDALLARSHESPAAPDSPVADIPAVPDLYGFGKRDREWMNLRA